MKWFKRWILRRKHNPPQTQTVDTISAHNSIPNPTPSGSYHWLGGRRHLSNVPYMLPSDTKEVNRLDFQHYMLRYALKSNYLAPIKRPTSILDLGCGTGRWMLEMSNAFPDARLVGFDLVTPTTINFPFNCSFKVGNILQGLPFADQSFDYVHQRLLVFGLPADQWENLLQDYGRVTSPGGWIELVEMDFISINRGPVTTKMVDWLSTACKQRGLSTSVSHRLESMLRTTGFINTASLTVPIPLGSWGGRLGSMAATDISTGTMTMKPLVIASTGISSEEFDQALQLSYQECEQYHSGINFYIAYGQRPSS